MKIVLFVSLIIIFILIIYLFLLKKELKRITFEIKKQKDTDTNQLLHQEMACRELQNLIGEINAILKSVKEEKIKIEKSKNSLNKMMMNVSHDLRTPLTSALGYMDILISNNLDMEKEKELKIVKERLKRLEELINSFFDFSKVVSNSANIKLEKVNLVAILEESILRYYEDYEKEKRKIILNSIRKCEMISNKEMLSRIFDNLIGNAYKHSKSDLKVKLKIAEGIKITFSNEIESNELDMNHLFDEFYTLDISRTKGNTGLGLAIAKEFTENLHGKIKATKRKNIITIILTFPNK